MTQNKVALVTGSGKGIGCACILEFARLGYDVIIHYHHSKKEAEHLKEKVEKEYDVKAILIQADLKNETEVLNMIHIIKETFHKVDVLVNNAAYCLDTLYEEKTKEAFMETLEVNVVGTFLLSRYIGDMMMQEKEGSIINITSTNGIDTYFPMCLDYDASKSAIISLTHNLALQYAPYIRVNAVAPGWVATENEMKDVDSEYIKSEEEKIFLKRIGKPEEIAKVVAFLASDDASYINNAIIRVDGGHYS
jgi:3-oxoacyl-[acyl-carrier protein] reductase